MTRASAAGTGARGTGPLRQARQRAAHDRHRVVPRDRRLRLAAERPGQPARERDPVRLGGSRVVAVVAPTNARARPSGRRARGAGEVRVHERRQVDARLRPHVMPEIEARVHLEQAQAAVGSALEVELRDAAQPEPPDDVAPERRDVRLVSDLDRSAVAISGGIRADLAAGELARNLAAAVDVDVVALDARLGAWNQLLDEDVDSGGGEPRPQLAQRGRGPRLYRLATAGYRLPRLVPAGERLGDQRELQVHIGRTRRVRRQKSACRQGKLEPFGELLEAGLVDEPLDELAVGDREAEALAQPLALARDEQQVPVPAV